MALHQEAKKVPIYESFNPPANPPEPLLSTDSPVVRAQKEIDALALRTSISKKALERAFFSGMGFKEGVSWRTFYNELSEFLSTNRNKGFDLTADCIGKNGHFIAPGGEKTIKKEVRKESRLPRRIRRS